MFKRLMGLLVAIIMLVTTLPTAAFANEATQNEPQTVEQAVVQQEPETPVADDPAGDSPASDAPSQPSGEAPTGNTEGGDPASEPPTQSEPAEGEPTQDLPIELPTADEAELITAATAAISALPSETTWQAFDAVEAAAAALYAVPADSRAQVPNAHVLTDAIETLRTLYAQAEAALDPTADIWENQHAIIAFVQMKKQMDVSVYIRPDTIDLMADPTAPDWLALAMAAFEEAEAVIVPAGGDLTLTATANQTLYQTLQKALYDVEEGGTVVVQKNITIADDVVLMASSSVSYTINTNKKTITLGNQSNFPGGSFQITAGNVTIKGGGRFTLTDSGAQVALCASGDATQLTLDGIRISVDEQNLGIALYVPNAMKVSISDCELSMGSGIVVNADDIKVENTTIDAYTPGGASSEISAVTVYGEKPLRLTMNGVDINTNQNTVLTVGKSAEVTGDVTVNVNNTTLTSTAAGAEIIYLQGNADNGLFGVTLANTLTFPALESGTYTLAEGQNLFGATSGGSIVAASIADAFKLTDGAILVSDYTQEGAALEIPMGKTLDASTYGIAAASLSVEGTLHVSGINAFTTPATFEDSGRLERNGMPYIAPKVADTGAGKPVFGVHTGGKMQAVKNGDVLEFTVLEGEVTIQRGTETSTIFEMDANHKLIINEGATVWLANNVALGSKNNIQGNIQYIVITDAKGKKNYVSLADAIAENSSIKLVRDMEGLIAPNETVTIDKALTIDLDGHSISFGQSSLGLRVRPAKKATVTIRNGTIGSQGASAIEVSGKKGAVATLNLESVTITNTIYFDSYVKLNMSKCKMPTPTQAIVGAAASVEANLTIKDSQIDYGGKEAQGAVYLPSVQTLAITDSRINSAGGGISLYGGTATLTNVTVWAQEAGSGTAITAMADNAQGLPISLTLNEGGYISHDSDALVFGYATGVTKAQRPLAVYINGAVLVTEGQDKVPLKMVGDADKAQVTEMITLPVITEATAYTVLGNAHTFTLENGDNDDRYTLICKDLSAALNRTSTMGAEKYIWWDGAYENKNEALRLSESTVLRLRDGASLSVKSISGFGNIDADAGDDPNHTDGGTITASSIRLSTVVYDDKSNVDIASINQLGGDTMVELLAATYMDQTDAPMLTIDGKLYANGLSSTPSAMFAIAKDGHMGVRKKEGAIEFVVISGTIRIANSSFVVENVLDIGDNYLTIMPGAKVVVDGNIEIKDDKEHIDGSERLYYEDVQELKTAVDNLPDDLTKLTYKHRSDVNRAIRLREIVVENGHDKLPAAVPVIAKLKGIEDVYLHYYIATNTELTSVNMRSGLLEIDGDASSAITIGTSAFYVPQDVLDLIKNEYTASITFEESTTKFEIVNGNTVKATASAAPNDAVTVNVCYAHSSGTPQFTSPVHKIVFRAVPKKDGATLIDIVPDSYSLTFNKKGAASALAIPVSCVFSNGMTYELDSNDTVAVTLAGKGKLPLDGVFTATLEDGNVLLTPKADTPPAKNKTYTGTLTFSVTQGQNTRTFEAKTITVKAVEVEPKVTLKVKDIDITSSDYYEETKYSISTYNAVVLSGANAADVRSIEFSGLPDVSIDYNLIDQYFGITSQTPFEKGVIKPTATLTFNEGTGFASKTLEVPIKLVQKPIAVKLAKKSATISSAVGKSVQVELVGTDKKNPFEFYTIQSIEALEGGKPSANVTAEFALASDRNKIIITLTTRKALTRTTKLTLRVTKKNNISYIDLPFTLAVKAYSVKLSKAKVEFNTRNQANQAVIPLKIATDSDTATLLAVNGVDAQNPGEVYVDYITFTCHKEGTLTLEGDASGLVKGSKRYTLVFEGVKAPLTLTVNIVDKYLALKLQKTSVSINTTLYDAAIIPLEYGGGIIDPDCVSFTHTTGVRVSYQTPHTSDVKYGNVYVVLNESAAKTETVYVNVRNAGTNPKKSQLKLTVKRNDKPLALRVSVKGKLSTNIAQANKLPIELRLTGNTASADISLLLNNAYMELIPEDTLDLNISRMQLEWGYDADVKAGKYRAALRLIDLDSGVNIVSNTFTVTAVDPKITVTVAPVTLHQAAALKAVQLQLNDSHYYVKDVQLAKPSDIYAVEKTDVDEYVIRYKSATPTFPKNKWKTNDSVTLNVWLEGRSKPISVKLSITNIQK